MTSAALKAVGAACAIALALAAPGAHAQSAKYTAKIGHLEAPTQPRHRGLEKVAELVKQRTNGEVEFKLYPLSQLGNARQMVEGVQFGSIECTVMPAAFLGGFNPAVSVLDIPYLYPTDRAKSQTLRAGAFGKAILDSFSSKGFVALTIWPNGRKSLTSNKAIASIDELKGQKFRVMDSKILVEQFAGVGASAIPIQFGELYTALQTGVVDGQENPLDTITTMKFHEVQKNLVVSEHGAMEDIVLFNPKWWNSLPAGHRAAIAKTFDELRPVVEQMKEKAQTDALALVKSSTTTVRIADEAERARLRQAMYPRARAAYLERAGAEGRKLIQIYESEFKKL
ncbi:MAG: TRAP transporter substrate-binding protein [Burkholderiales bacterium]|nr:TRAP transporter substrate-binding protein [Burkholderiales bacterium]